MGIVTSVEVKDKNSDPVIKKVGIITLEDILAQLLHKERDL